MKTIGILGGMSWESSLIYYQNVNQLIKNRLGGLHSAKVVMVSVDFGPIEKLMRAENWDQVAKKLIESAQQVQAGGADLMLIATNTMHKMYDQIQKAVRIPIIHIADVAGDAAASLEYSTVGLLGTRFTMEQDFYRSRLEQKYGLNVLVPGENERMRVDQIIFEELVVGDIKEESKTFYLEVINKLIDEGAQGIILGCTEIPMLIDQADVSVSIFDTTYLHALAGVEMAVS